MKIVHIMLMRFGLMDRNLSLPLKKKQKTLVFHLIYKHLKHFVKLFEN